MLEFLAKLGLATASSAYTIWWYMDEPECPESLLK